MAKVSYKASTSGADQPIEASVEIIDPKITSTSHSIDSNLSNEDKLEEKDKKDKKSNKPSGTSYKQQRLPAWQPILTADTVLPAFFLLGIALIPIGVGLLVTSNNLQEYSYEYTDCIAIGSNKTKCSDIIGKGRKFKTMGKTKCECIYNFKITDQIKAPVFFYYGLSNYFQNHRRYSKSRNDKQLGQDKRSFMMYFNLLNNDCDPYTEDKAKRTIVPCGIIANSMFTDKYHLYYVPSNGELEPIELAQTHIAWPTDKRYLFSNPSEGFDHKSASPPLWGDTRIDDLDHNHPGNNGFDNEHFIVWMRTAAFPTFRKLWARIDHDQNLLWREGLPKGNYQIRIEYNYRVKFDSYTAGKYIYISNTSWLGGKNTFLGYAYITVGAVCFILWIFFLVMIKKYGQKPKDIVDFGRKTQYEFQKPKKVSDSGDESTQPLRATNTTVTFSDN